MILARNIAAALGFIVFGYIALWALGGFMNGGDPAYSRRVWKYFALLTAGLIGFVLSIRFGMRTYDLTHPPKPASQVTSTDA